MYTKYIEDNILTNHKNWFMMYVKINSINLSCTISPIRGWNSSDSSILWEQNSKTLKTVKNWILMTNEHMHMFWCVFCSTWKAEVCDLGEKINYSVSGQSIRLRLTTEMKRWIFDKASREERTASDVMRSLIVDAMEREKK